MTWTAISSWMTAFGGGLLALYIGYIISLVKTKSEVRGAKDTADAKIATAKAEVDVAVAEKATALVLGHNALVETVRASLDRLSALETKIETQQVELQNLHQLVAIKSEKIAQLERLPLCVGEQCPMLQMRDGQIASLKLQIAGLEARIHKMEESNKP